MNIVPSLCKKANNQLKIINKLHRYLGFRGKEVPISSFIYANFNYCPLILHYWKKSINHRWSYKSVMVTNHLYILWKDTVSAKLWVNCSNLCWNCAFPQTFHTIKLGDIMVFYVVFYHLQRLFIELSLIVGIQLLSMLKFTSFSFPFIIAVQLLDFFTFFHLISSALFLHHQYPFRV